MFFWELGVGFGEVSVEGPRLFEGADVHLTEKQALGGTMGGKATDYARTKAEILSCQEWPHPIHDNLPCQPHGGQICSLCCTCCSQVLLLEIFYGT